MPVISCSPGWQHESVRRSSTAGRNGFFTAIERIFVEFGGNFSLTLKGSLTPVTQALPNRAKLFWNATGAHGSVQTKREQAAPSVNRELRKALVAQA